MRPHEGTSATALSQPFQDRYEQAVRDDDADVLIKICPGKHGRWRRICVLDDGHEHLGIALTGAALTGVVAI